MKNNVTELVFIIDRSGSMSGLEADTVGGFNSALKQQKKQEGTVLVTTVLFNGDKTTVHDRAPIDSVPEMKEDDFVPEGCTALLDALGSTIEHIKDIHKYARADDVPEHTIFLITTDGMENASRSYSSEKVKSLIKTQSENAGWEFIFVAANIDAVQTAREIGIREDRAAKYKAGSQGVRNTFAAMGKAITSIRCDEELSASWKEELE